MNSAIPLLVVLLVTMVQTILAHPAKNDDFQYTTDDCPPGIWVCRKKRVEIPKPQAAESNDCPPGIWTCQKKRRSLEAAKQLETRRQQLLQKMMMREKERQAAKMMNAAKVQAESQSQMKKSYDCPPGIWVC